MPEAEIAKAIQLLDLEQGAEKLADNCENGVLTPLSSFPRKRESRDFKGVWIPALRFAAAGMTVFTRGGHFSAAC